MKKLFAILLVACMAVSLCACSSNGGSDDAADVKGEGVMTYAEYMAAPHDSEVTVETYVQAKESWWDNKATIYTQDKEGAYFLYDLPISEEDYNKLTPGTKIKVTGYKTEYSSQIEIIDATFEIEEGSYIAPAFDATSILGTDEIKNHMTQLVTIKGLTIEASDANGAPFLYNWDGSGSDGDHVYFTASLNGQSYSFNVRTYLCGPETEVYKAATTLNVGDVVDVECYLYYYTDQPQPRVISITKK